jgi:hypothetical protein
MGIADELRTHLKNLEDVADRLQTFCAPAISDVKHYVDQFRHHLTAARSTVDTIGNTVDTPAPSPGDTPNGEQGTPPPAGWEDADHGH